jgi:hypothetical protein
LLVASAYRLFSGCVGQYRFAVDRAKPGRLKAFAVNAFAGDAPAAGPLVAERLARTGDGADHAGPVHHHRPHMVAEAAVGLGIARDDHLAQRLREALTIGYACAIRGGRGAPFAGRWGVLRPDENGASMSAPAAITITRCHRCSRRATARRRHNRNRRV